MKSVIDDIVVESPKAYGQQPLSLYVPRATFESPGIIRPSDEHFVLEDGVLKISPDYVGNGGGGNVNIVVDSALSETSTNPVQNLVITREINRRFAQDALKEQIGDATNNTNGLLSVSDKISLDALKAKVVIDDELSTTSGNLVRNRVVALALQSAMYRENLINIIGSPDERFAGLMSFEDKANLDTLVQFLGDEAGDTDAFVNTIREILDIFENYSEGLDLVNKLASKVESYQVDNRIETLRPVDTQMSDTSENAVQNKVIKSYIESYVAANGGSGSGSGSGSSLNQVCLTRLGRIEYDMHSMIVTSATMSADLSGLSTCLVTVNGVSRTVELNDGQANVGSFNVITNGTGMSVDLYISGRTIYIQNFYSDETGTTHLEPWGYIDVTVLAPSEDLAICNDYACIPYSGTYNFSVNLEEGDTVQLRFGPINDAVYENLNYPMSTDCGLYYDHEGWIISGESDYISISHNEYEPPSSPMLISVIVIKDDSSNSTGPGSSGAGSSKLSKVIKVYPYSTWVIAPADSSKSYYISVKDYSMGKWGDRCALVWHNGYLEQIGASGMLEFHQSGDSILCSYGSSDGEESLLVIVQEIDAYEITCFIEGTRVLLRDPVTHEIYSKNIEDVKHFDYCAYWMPNLGRLTASRVIAPPIIGECTEYDKLYFSDGSIVNVFGTQFFWHADKDRLVDWKKLTPEDRVCTFEGNLVNFVKSEHVISDKPIKHYTLMVFMGKYIANGIQVGDKRELFYPRMLDPVRKKYWDRLNDADQKHLIRVHQQGMKRRNWKFTEEYRNVVKPIEQKIADAERVIKDMKQYLYNTDYLVTKLLEGLITEDEFAPVKEQRQQARDSINEHELILMGLMAECEQKKKDVRDLVLGTHVPKFAGKFIGKSKAVI